MSRWYLNCGNCGRDFHVSSGFEGMNVKCRKCGHSIRIPNKQSAINAFQLVLVVFMALGLWIGEFGGALIVALFFGGLVYFFIKHNNHRAYKAFVLAFVVFVALLLWTGKLSVAFVFGGLTYFLVKHT